MEKSIIKKRQRWVLTHPCRTVSECGALGYRADFTFGGQMVATVLTIDTFTAPVAWQAQIGIVEKCRCKPMKDWTVNDGIAAIEIAKQMLDGVGQPATDGVVFDALSITVSRKLTADETGAVLNAVRNRQARKPVTIGEIGEYDFNDQQTRVGERAYIPKSRSLIYGN